MICYIDMNGNTRFCKTMKDLNMAIKNGYVRAAYINNKRIY